MDAIEPEDDFGLEIEAPAGLLPDLTAWGIDEIERGVCEDTYDNRRTIRANKGQWNIVFDRQGMPTGYIQVITAEMYQAAQGLSKADLLEDPEDFNSDYLHGLRLILAPEANKLAPSWVMRTTRVYMDQQEQRRMLGPDADLMQTRLARSPTRCNVMKGDGTRCWSWSDGSTDTLGMCRLHARQRGKVNPLGMSNAQIARNRIQSALPAASEVLEELMHGAVSEQVRLAAVAQMMDRGGIRGGFEVDQKTEVVITEHANIVTDRLKKLADGHVEKAKILKQIAEAQPQATPAPEPIDAEVIEDE